MMEKWWSRDRSSVPRLPRTHQPTNLPCFSSERRRRSQIFEDSKWGRSFVGRSFRVSVVRSVFSRQRRRHSRNIWILKWWWRYPSSGILQEELWVIIAYVPSFPLTHLLTNHPCFLGGMKMTVMFFSKLWPNCLHCKMNLSITKQMNTNTQK